MSALERVRADLFLIFSKDQPSLHPEVFPRNSSSSPALREARGKVRASRWGISLSWSLITGNSSDKVLQDPCPRLLPWKRPITHAIPAGSVVHLIEKETTWGSCLSVAHV
jgi:hypothetical protein